MKKFLICLVLCLLLIVSNIADARKIILGDLIVRGTIIAENVTTEGSTEATTVTTFTRSVLKGGGDNALDGILADDMSGTGTFICFVGTAAADFIPFIWSPDSAATETTITIIKPDNDTSGTYAGDGRWLLCKINADGVETYLESGEVGSVTIKEDPDNGTNWIKLTVPSSIGTNRTISYADAAQTGTGSPVFATSPTLVTPVIGAATGSSLVLTGNIAGSTPVLISAGGAELSAAQCKGYFHVITAADTVTLPAIADTGVGIGSCVVIYVRDGGETVIVEVDNSDVITLYGTALDAGDTIDSPGAAGDFIALIADAANSWRTVGTSGTWTDGDAS